jgi:hypothetical protein
MRASAFFAVSVLALSSGAAVSAQHLVADGGFASSLAAR